MTIVLAYQSAVVALSKRIVSFPLTEEVSMVLFTSCPAGTLNTSLYSTPFNSIHIGP